jgi:hypothetical protein
MAAERAHESLPPRQLAAGKAVVQVDDLTDDTSPKRCNILTRVLDWCIGHCHRRRMPEHPAGRTKNRKF